MGWGASNTPGEPVEPFSESVRIGLTNIPPGPPVEPDNRVDVDTLAEFMLETIWPGDDKLWLGLRDTGKAVWRSRAQELLDRFDVREKQ